MTHTTDTDELEAIAHQLRKQVNHITRNVGNHKVPVPRLPLWRRQLKGYQGGKTR